MKKRDILKLIIIITMTVDHMGAVLFVFEPIYRIIGRAAFPLVAYQAAEGAVKTRSFKRYLLRLFVFACLSQLPYMMLFPGSLNPIFTVLFGVAAIGLWERGGVSRLLSAAVCLASFVVPLDYGAYGVFMILMFNLFREDKFRMLFSFIFLNIAYAYATGVYLQAYCLTALFPILFFREKEKETGFRLPKYLFYFYYPAHLLVLAAVFYTH
jgi:hypothetical protein